MFSNSITKFGYKIDATTYAFFLCAGALIALSSYYGDLKIYLLLAGILFVSIIFSLKIYYFLLFVLFIRSSLEGSLFQYATLPPLHHGLAAILLLAGFFYLFLIKEKGVHNIPIITYMVVFLSYFFILSLTAEFPFVGFQYFTKLAISFIMFVLILDVIKSRRHIDCLVWAIFLSGIIPVIFAAYEYIFDLGRLTSGGFYRITSTFSSFNKFAIHLGIVTLLGIYLFLFAKSNVKKFFIGILILVYSGFFIFTYSRGAWIAFLFTIFLMGLLKGGERYRKLLLPAAIMPVIIILFIPSVLNRFIEIFVVKNVIENNLLGRLNFWKQGLALTYNDPITFFFGNGIGYYAVNSATIPHNDFILLFVESGFMGLFLYLLVLMITIHSSYSNIGKTENKEYRHLSIACFAIICFNSILMLSENMLYAVGTAWYFWAIVGISLCLMKLSLKSGRKKTP
jgi:hypothetical protein